MPRDPRRAQLRYSFALLFTVLAVAVRIPLSPLLGSGVPFILFFPVVTLSAWFGGLGPGLLATALSALASFFIFIKPYHALALPGSQDIFRLILFIGGSTLISWVCGALRAANLRAQELLESRERALASVEEAEAARSGLAAIVESSGDAILGKTLDGIITSWNRSAERVYGYTPEEVIGRHVSMLAPPEGRGEIDEILEKIRRGEHVEHSETVRVTKDGRRIDISLTVSPVRDAAGRLAGASTIARDITARKRQETAERFLTKAAVALGSSLDYETTLSTVAQLAVPHFADWCSVDVVGDDGAVNRLAVAHVDPAKVAWAHELQERYPPDPAEPTGVYNVLRTGESEFYPDIPDELLVAGARDAEHLEVIRRIGFRSAMVVPLKARGKILGVITFVNAESGRHHTREDLQLAEDLAARAALAVDNARLYRAERQTRQAAERNSAHLMRLQSVAAALSRALTPREVADTVIEQGLSSLGAHAGTVAVLSKNGTEFELVGSLGFPPEVVSKWERFPANAPVAIADAVRDGAPVLVGSFDKWLDRYPALGPLSSVTGSRALSAFPLVVEGRTIGALGFSFLEAQKFNEDDRAFMHALAQQCAQALERARLYETEQRLRAEAETANRIKDEFLATVSHELRTPLTAIVGWSSMLRTNQFGEEATARAIETIERNAKVQTQIIEDLLDVSRIITGKFQLSARYVELDAIVEAAIEAVRPAADAKSISLSSSRGEGVFTVWGDPARLQQVMWNLLSNGVKFTPRGGSVEVKLERVESHLQLVVGDTGQGIGEEFLPFVFERFRQADSAITRKHGGLGLGLAIVRHLVEMHGGSVRVESAGAGQGARFVVELPLPATLSTLRQTSQQAAQGADARTNVPAAATDDATTLADVRVLVVEDEEDARALLTTMIKSSGATVLAVASVAEALSEMEQFQPDVLVSDIGMPGEDGYSLIRKLRQGEAGRGGALPAIALTAYARDEDRAHALDAGYDSHMAKPVSPAELLSEVGRLAALARRGDRRERA